MERKARERCGDWIPLEEVDKGNDIEIFSPEILKHRSPVTIYGLDDIKPEHHGSVLTIGNFDGIHKAHLHLIRVVTERAKEFDTHSMLLTFWPPPFRVLKPFKKVYQITSLDDRLMIIGKAGIDYAVVEDFNLDFASIFAHDFIQDIVLEKIRPKEIVVGYDFTFGKARYGTPDLLKEVAEPKGVKVTKVMPIIYDQNVVSSTLIRKMIMDGKVSRVAYLMGRYYYIKGRVAAGSGLGKNLGYPTANIELENDPFLKPGVYAVLVKLPDVMLKGALNYGVRPTFKKIGYKLVMEVHIPGFQENIYGLPVMIHFVRRIRDEIKFRNASFLKRQIEKDVSYAMRVLEEIPLHMRV